MGNSLLTFIPYSDSCWFNNSSWPEQYLLVRGELITGQQLYHSPQSALTNYLTWSVKPSFSCEISNSLWFWQIPNYSKPCAAAGKLCFVAIPGRKAQSKGGGIPQTGIKPSKTSKIFLPKAALESLGGFFLLTGLVFPFALANSFESFHPAGMDVPLERTARRNAAGFCRHQHWGKQHFAENESKQPQKALVGFALHVEELFNWQNYVTGETSCFCNYGGVCVCQETSRFKVIQLVTRLG